MGISNKLTVPIPSKARKRAVICALITEIEATFPEKEICAYIGGLHLYKSSEEEGSMGIEMR
jgi:metal-dependent hydrolase (beta-lactamase superfamily II)